MEFFNKCTPTSHLTDLFCCESGLCALQKGRVTYLQNYWVFCIRFDHSLPNRIRLKKNRYPNPPSRVSILIFLLLIIDWHAVESGGVVAVVLVLVFCSCSCSCCSFCSCCLQHLIWFDRTKLVSSNLCRG